MAGPALTWLGQAGFLLRGAGTALLVDAFLSDHPDRQVPAPAPPRRYQELTAVLASHEHWDHLDLPAWPTLAAASPGARFVVPAPVTGQVSAAGVPAGRVLGAEPGTPVRLGAATVTPVPARHGVHVADAYTFGRELSGGACRYLGYVIELAGRRIYHAGDTLDYDGLAGLLRELRVDVALLPINGRDAAREAADIVGNLSAAEAAELAAAAGVALAVPMHYDMFAANQEDPGRFVTALRRRGGVAALVPAVGVPIGC